VISHATHGFIPKPHSHTHPT